MHIDDDDEVKISSRETPKGGERGVHNSPKRPIGVPIEKDDDIEEILKDQEIRNKEFADRITTDVNAEMNDSGDKIDDLKVY
jgi:hypothetical protein